MLDFLILAAHSEAAAPEGKGASIEWAIVLFLMAIGLGITLSPPKRTTEIKKSKDE